MITHYVILSSSYSKGKRIALHYTIGNKFKYEELKEILMKITEECGKDVSVSTHFIQTDSKDWESVVKKDHFFKEVEVIGDISKFITLIKKDRVLIGLDVAKYILCKVKCTHLKLEKLVYLCYADYLCKYDKELFKDKIYAYKYGPVVKTVYDKYKVHGYKEIEKDEESIDITGLFEMPARSRILFAERGVDKIQSIDATLEIYGKYSASDLVKITHIKNAPWNISYKEDLVNKTINNEIIKKYHCNEVIN